MEWWFSQKPFFKKEWPQKELDGLVALEAQGLSRILPIWHKVSVDEVAHYSPTLVRFYNGRGTAEQWIKEGKYALNWTRLSCHRFVANRVRLSLFVLAYNLGNFLRRLCLPKAVKHWSLRSVQVKLIKMGGRLVRHSRWLIFQLSEVSVPRRLFQGVLDRIGRLSPAPS